ncbi:phage baseplate plug family protein [Yersinia pekkanenii]|uniref:Cyanophage baseplate Pam3 plug gp18 domain-containing protein n=1 Tax=Yersinia pekkanenii TaxID=1288385 RepID=A0A0T9PRN3_9GAMM|nr:hypothetical protein [Yersinia pekkanenii]CNH77782.1 Uncharacterised protein [Yersinia pekkanenii]CRY69363.1 Uncharacterised protein [Yersinia pekkanenii]
MKIIPLTNGLAYQKLTVTVGDFNLWFYLRWLTRYGYFTVDIHDANGTPIALGRALHVGIDLLSGINTNIGKISLDGESATIANLGVNNKLKWYPQ